MPAPITAGAGVCDKLVRSGRVMARPVSAGLVRSRRKLLDYSNLKRRDLEFAAAFFEIRKPAVQRTEDISQRHALQALGFLFAGAEQVADLQHVVHIPNCRR